MSFTPSNSADKAWEDVTYQTLNSAWRKLWPECVTECDIEKPDTQIVEEIVSMDKSLGVDIDGADTKELAEDTRRSP